MNNLPFTVSHPTAVLIHAEGLTTSGIYSLQGSTVTGHSTVGISRFYGGVATSCAATIKAGTVLTMTILCFTAT